MEPNPIITTVEGVEALAKRLKGEKVIAVDTEADSFFHYFDKLCLLQIGTRREQVLVDPLTLPEHGLEPLAPILADPHVRKILHAAEYDLFILSRRGLRIQNLFDTMISAQLLGYPAVGLAALVERHFGVSLSKDQQRTDWSKRELRPAQIEYALSDVRYLIELCEILEKDLKSKHRLAWAQAEFRALEQRSWPERSFDLEGYLRIKGARQLKPKSLAILRELYLMRDKRARESDRPPFKVLGNGTLLDLAENPPASKRGLLGRRGLTDLVVRRLGQDMLDAVRRGLEGPEHPPLERREAPVRRRLDRRAEWRLERLKHWRAQRARELELDPGVFCANAALEEIAAALPGTRGELERLEHVKSWWAEAFGGELFALLEDLRARESREAPSESHPAPAPSSDAPPRRRRGRRRRGSRKRGSGHGTPATAPA
jgi:ribonuclease D